MAMHSFVVFWFGQDCFLSSFCGAHLELIPTQSQPLLAPKQEEHGFYTEIQSIDKMKMAENEESTHFKEKSIKIYLEIKCYRGFSWQPSP